jgi:hypothetical protein
MVLVGCFWAGHCSRAVGSFIWPESPVERAYDSMPNLLSLLISSSSALVPNLLHCRRAVVARSLLSRVGEFCSGHVLEQTH